MRGGKKLLLDLAVLCAAIGLVVYTIYSGMHPL
jgi:hypothetical protein